jgi:hypothetical protein
MVTSPPEIAAGHWNAYGARLEFSFPRYHMRKADHAFGKAALRPPDFAPL